MGQGGAMLGQLGQAGKSERESMVPLGIGDRSETGGARYCLTFLFPCPVLARGSLLSHRKSITPNVLARAILSP